jgi:hypothetical protein
MKLNLLTPHLGLDIGFILEKMENFDRLYLYVRQKTVDFQDQLTNQLWNARLQRTFKMMNLQLM